MLPYSVLGDKYSRVIYPGWEKNIYADYEAKCSRDLLTYNMGAIKMCYENVISESKSISIAAYGLLPEEIIIKEIEGKLTVKSAPKIKTTVQSNLSLSYTLKNVKLDSITLMLGVLTLDFVDTENVVIHAVNGG